MPEKPTVPIVPSELPASLAAWGEYSQFVPWRLVWNSDRGKWDKLPVRGIHTGMMTWEAARDLCASDLSVDGVGFVFTGTDPFWVIDLDGCRDPITGTCTPEAMAIVARFPGCAVEVSVSKTGLHIFGAWEHPIPHKKRVTGLEFYSEGRFIANTFWLGEDGCAWTVADGPIYQFIADMGLIDDPPAVATPGTNGADPDWDDTPETVTDAAVTELLGRENTARGAFGMGATATQLWQGDPDVLAQWYPPQSDAQDFGTSEAVYALLSKLRFYTGGHAVQMQRLLQTSPLGADYDERKSKLSINRVIAAGGDVYRAAVAPEALPAAAAPVDAEEFALERAGAVVADRTANSLIEGVLDCGTLGCVLGAPGSSKTFQAIDMGMSVARGVPWLGHEVPAPGPVVYVAAEGRRGIRKRIHAYTQQHGLQGSDVPFYLLPMQIKLLDNALQLVRLRDRLLKLGGVRLVFFDTLSMSIAGGAENAPETMTAAMEAAQWLMNELGATVVLVHHLGKDAARGARGHSSLFGALDTELTVEQDGDQFRIRTTKQRDLELGVEHTTRLDVVQLGADSAGKPITSCVVAEALYAGATVAAGPRLNPTEREIHKIYTGLLATEPITVPESIIIELEAIDPRGRTVGSRIGLEINRVKDAYFRMYEDKADSRADSKGTCGRTWRRGVKYLQARDSINLFGGFMWDETPQGGQLVQGVRPTVRPNCPPGQLDAV